MTRQKTIAALRANPNVDVLIVGGGVNGIGVFRELAAQGIDVLLVDKGDFCSGASAASSHMLHGGLRYLENAEFRLVNEALKERDLLLRNAPHYAIPAPTMIPIFSWFSGLLNAPLKFVGLLDRPSERGWLVIKIGLTFYDWFTRSHRTMPTHYMISRRKSLALRPKLNPQIVATANYYDAWMPMPERICVELLLDAEALHSGARALNYMSLESGMGDSVTLCDQESGETLTVKPRAVVNAAGPWIDFANQALQQQTRFIGGTKGSHLVVDNPELHTATQGSEIFFENDDGRIVLFFPLEDKVLMGTTDIPVETPEGVICTDEEVEYILGMVRKVFPGIHLDASQIVFKFSGVRPLPAMDAKSAGQISRDHSIRVSAPNDSIAFPVYSLVGGKWTTFRAFGEQTADQVMAHLGVPRRVSTEQMSIGGGKDYPQTEAEKQNWITALAEKTRLPFERVEGLFGRYGTRAAQVAAFISSEPDQMLAHIPGYSRREVLFLLEEEKTIHLDDLILRRSLLAMLGRVNRAGLEELASAAGWSAEEVERTITILREQFGTQIQ